MRDIVEDVVDDVRDIVDDVRASTEECFACSALGHLDNFNYPLYNDCDVIFLESLFDPDFEFGMFARVMVPYSIE